jgi:DNA-directed RNA polymerase subunit RPC12/RpoP
MSEIMGLEERLLSRRGTRIRHVAKKKLSPRAERRAGERAAEKLARDRERLAYLEPGGDSVRPIDLESASQVEPHVRSLVCLRCGTDVRLEEHAAVTEHLQRLRVARLVCPRCGARRDVWFRLRVVS